MAQLKDSVVQGSLRVTDTEYTNHLSVSSTSNFGDAIRVYNATALNNKIVITTNSANTGVYNDNTSQVYLGGAGTISVVRGDTNGGYFLHGVKPSSTTSQLYGRMFIARHGTSNTTGVGLLSLGNELNSSTTGNAEGKIQLFSVNTGSHYIDGKSTTAHYTHTLQNASGTIAHTDIAGGGTGATSFTDNKAVVAKTTGATQSLVSSDLSITTDSANDVTIASPSGEQLKIKSNSTLQIYSTGTSTTSIIFNQTNSQGTTEAGRFNTKGNFVVGASDNNSETDKLHVYGTAIIDDTTDSEDTASGALKVNGGAGIAKKLYIGDTLNLLGTTAETAILNFSRTGTNTPNYINIPASSALAFSVGGGAVGTNIRLAILNDAVHSWTDNTVTLGTSAIRWKSLYATTSLCISARNGITAYNSNALGSFIGPGVFSSSIQNAGSGYYQMGNAVQYGRWYISAVGAKPVATTTTDPNTGATTITYSGYVQGYSHLELGNDKIGANTNKGVDNNARGRIRIWGADANYTDLMSNPSGKRTVYLPKYGGTMYLLHSSGTSKIGSSTQSVYVEATTGRVVAGYTYAGGTAVILNSESKAQSTADFYAPTTSGTAGQPLISAGSGVAPSWYGGLILTGTATADWTATINSMIISGTNNYGATLPSTNLTTGRIFFQTTPQAYELPAGGAAGQILIKNTGTTRDVVWSANAWIANGSLKINRSDGGNCYIDLLRASNADWRILNSSGNLIFQCNWTSSKGSYYNVFTMNFSSGDVGVNRGNFFINGAESHFNLNPQSSAAYLVVGPVIDSNADVQFRTNNTARWSLSARPSGENNMLLLYSNVGECYATTWASDGQVTFWNRLHVTSYDVTLTIYTSPNWINFTGAPSKPFYFDNQVQAVSGFKVYNTAYTLDSNGLGLSGIGTNKIYFGPNDAANGVGGALNNLVFSSWYGVSFTTSCDGATYKGTNAFSINCRNGYAYAARMYGAVWNDYAEYRQADTLEPGRVVVEYGNGAMKLSDKRLDPSARIVSDTYGFAIGKTETNQTPIAVCGRVLVYPYKEKMEYKPGAAVCSAPDGTVDIMTRDEIREYPECIIGTVSEIPQYDTWGSENVKVNNRIWIYVR